MKCPRCGLVHAPLEEVCRRCEIDLRSEEPRPRSRAPSAPVAVKVSPFARIKEQIADKTRARRASPAPTAAPAPEAGPAAASAEKKTKTEPAAAASVATPKPAVAVFSLAKRKKFQLRELLKKARPIPGLRQLNCVQCGGVMLIARARPYSRSEPIALLVLGGVLMVLGIFLPWLLVPALIGMAAGALYLRLGKTFWKCGACGFVVPRAGA